MLAAVQAIEVRHAVNSKQDCLAVDHKRTVPIPKRAFDNQWIPIAPVVTVAGEKPYPLAFTLDNQAVASCLIS
jgi:hypothetical protein